MQKGLFSIIIFLLLLPAIFSIFWSDKSYKLAYLDSKSSAMQLASLRRSEFENNVRLILKQHLNYLNKNNSFAKLKSVFFEGGPLKLPIEIDTKSKLVRYSVAQKLCILLNYIRNNFDATAYFGEFKREEISTDISSCTNELYDAIIYQELNNCISITIDRSHTHDDLIVEFFIPELKFSQKAFIKAGYTLEEC